MVEVNEKDLNRFKDIEDTKIFGEWSVEDVEIRDSGLKNYIELSPKVVPHTHGHHGNKRFGKADVNIVERLMNKLMRSGSASTKAGGKFMRRRTNFSGKKNSVYKVIERAFEKINDKTGENPVEILVRALENSGPREETNQVVYGAVRYHEAVDSAPSRRLDFALNNIVMGASVQAYQSDTSLADALAEELMAASRGDRDSYAIRKKEDVERVAQSSR